jgi:hypothetical protein
MTAPRVDFALTSLRNGKVLAIGGRSGLESGLLATAELYDPGTGLWTPTGSLLTPREGPTSTLLGSDKVLITGGDTANDAIFASAELYDPASGQWTAAGTMRNARSDHRAVLLADNQVLVAGGFGLEDLPTNVELYDAESGSWTPTLPLITGRAGHSAFRFASGKVLLVGGFNFNDRDKSATSELYDPASAVAKAFTLTDPRKQPAGEFQFAFNNTPGIGFTVESATSPAAPPASWTPIGKASEVLPGDYEFTDTTIQSPLRFYRVRSP